MKRIVISTLFAFIFLQSNAQLDSVVNFCSSYLKYPYISDGQQYRALLSSGEVAEFRMTFYGNVTYRMVVATEPTENSAIFRLYDENHNELFVSSNYDNSTYWDFNFTSTVDCFVEAELKPGKKSGFIIMLLGFKQ